MILEEKLDNDIFTIKLKGNISTLEDTIKFKDSMEKSCHQVDKINLYIYDSKTINSAIIGMLLRKKQNCEVDVNIVVKEEELFNLFKKLNLIEELNIEIDKYLV